ncbi:MAG: FAD-dependent oxidoreductase [Deltaproteobacteria bacterium]|nr:FAD-dependent oxidoreductase [Deltaproteobacteria bacterium]
MAMKINGFKEGQRISSRELLQSIYEGMEQGESSFEVVGSGHHDIGGPLWNPDGSPLRFYVKNPGQRVGSMGLQGTEIVVEGSTPADAGWLNAGATLVIKGDGGDTTGHCAAAGAIYVRGRVGARSGSLMKHDPDYEPPQLWVLKNTGSFPFEFMGGGIGVVCGYQCEGMDSVLGDRACVGMVGGVVYVRGPVQGLSDDVWLIDLDDGDRRFLSDNLPLFLSKVGRLEVLRKLSDLSRWHKIVAKSYEERKKRQRPSIHEFLERQWISGGIFGDVVADDYSFTAGLVNTGEQRLRIPHWLDRHYSAPCQASCPSAIPTQERIKLLREGKVKEALELVLRYSPFPGSVCGEVCPNLCMDACTRAFLDHPVFMKDLGKLSLETAPPQRLPATGKKIAVVGGGPGGLSAAWQLALKGHQVTVYEADQEVGGKLRQVIPEERLSRQVLEAEIRRIRELGIEIRTGVRVDDRAFAKIRGECDALVVASGAHNPVAIPFPGHQRVRAGIEFLKAINRGERPKVGNRVVVIGAGNAGMDVGLGAFAMGAAEVTAVDIRRPAAYPHEIAHFEKLGGRILWPFETAKVEGEGLHGKDGRLIGADEIFFAIGERPDLSFLPRAWLDARGMAEIDGCGQFLLAPGVFAVGDATAPGLLTHAIGGGREVAEQIDNLLNGRELVPIRKREMIPQSCLRKEYYRPLKRGHFKVDDVVQLETNRCLSCGVCRDCSMCLEACPEGAITREEKADGGFEYVSEDRHCIGCGICAGICPCGIWSMEAVV